MKTLISFLATFFAFGTIANAQFSENFDQNISGLSSNCWIVNQVNYTTTSSDVINGTGSAFTNPPTSTSGERTLSTPFLNITSTSFTVSFLYKTSSKIAGNATRTLNIGLVDKNGVFTSLQILTMDKTSPTSVLSHNATYTLPSTGVYRLEIRIGGATGDGNSRVIFDDLYASASAYYGPVNHCNPAAVAINNSYTAGSITTVTGNILANDQIPSDNEIYSVVLASAPSQGTLVLNADGTFTYTPDVSFTGGPVVFSYYIVDNGYTPSTSNTAFVTINYPTPVVLPVKLLNFTASIKGSAAEMQWTVDNIEDGNRFEVEKSTDGKSFKSIQTIAAQEFEQYRAVDENPGSGAFYRIKIVNKDGSTSYSKTVFVKGNGSNQEYKLIGNPVADVLTISATQPGTIQSISIYSAAGQLVYHDAQTVRNNAALYTASIGHLKSGTYIINIESAGSRKAMKFIKK